MNKRLPLTRLLHLALVSVMPGCGDTTEDEILTEEPAAMATTESTASPDTTAEGIWTYLAAANYRENWRLWPGKDRLYAGVEPHGMLLTTYANDIAFRALSSGSTQLPDGAILVKENYMPDSTFAAVATMYRARGYNPDHQDWFFAKHDPMGVVEVAGRDPMCQSCHSGAPGGDYLYTELP